MKKVITPALKDFISDFKLRRIDNVISFEATIEFASEVSCFTFKSEVEIITIDNQKIDVIYLLSSELPKYNLVDMFPSNNHKILYTHKCKLRLKGMSKLYGHYLLSIHPTISMFQIIGDTPYLINYNNSGQV